MSSEMNYVEVVPQELFADLMFRYRRATSVQWSLRVRPAHPKGVAFLVVVLW